MDRLVLKTMTAESPKAQIFRGKAASVSQPVPPWNSLARLKEHLLDSAVIKIYHGFPERLNHGLPHWVEPGGLFQIRVRLQREKEQKSLTDPVLGRAILDSAKFYEAQMRWCITLFL